MTVVVICVAVSPVSTTTIDILALTPPLLRIRHYAMYMAGEKTKEEDMTKLSDPLERCRISNPHLLALHKELCVLYEEGTLDGFGLYIFGIVLKVCAL